MDNHQSELAEALEEYLVCSDVANLINIVGIVERKRFPPGDPSPFVQSINKLLNH